MSVYVFSVCALAHLSIFFWCISLVRRNHAPSAGIVAMIAAALVYDNTIISLGTAIGSGTLLQMLSWPRFALHALLTPFLLVAAIQFAAAAGIVWAKDRRWRIANWMLVVAMIIFGALDRFIGLEAVPACFDGILRYTSNLHPSHFCSPDDQQVVGAGPPVPAIVGTVFSLIVGFAIWRRVGWIWLMSGALVMFAVAALPVSLYGLAPGNSGEVALLTAYAATAWRFRKPQSA